MSPTYPNELTQEVDRRWQRRTKDGSMPIPRSDNLAGGGSCPSCSKSDSITPVVSESRGASIVHHLWRCQACGHEWETEA